MQSIFNTATSVSSEQLCAWKLSIRIKKCGKKICERNTTTIKKTENQPNQCTLSYLVWLQISCVKKEREKE